MSAGFRTTGVCPFNPKAVLDKLSNSEVSSNEELNKTITFSQEMIKKYTTRFENGYNIFTDKSYVQWLRKFHPDYLPPGEYITLLNTLRYMFCWFSRYPE